MLSVYAASKAFMHSFTESLHVEYKGKGVDVIAITPHFVVSDMSKRSRPALDCPLPKSVVGPALNGLGSEVIFSPYWYHSLMQ